MERKTPKARNVKVSDLKVNEEFAPKPDPVFNHLLFEAVKGRTPVHFAVIAFKCLKRFDATHRPELTVSGKHFIAQIVEAWPEGQPWPMWVYPSGDKFIASDDYFTFAACEQERQDFVPCYVLGTPDQERVEQVSENPQGRGRRTLTGHRHEEGVQRALGSG